MLLWKAGAGCRDAEARGGCGSEGNECSLNEQEDGLEGREPGQPLI